MFSNNLIFEIIISNRDINVKCNIENIPINEWIRYEIMRRKVKKSYKKEEQFKLKKRIIILDKVPAKKDLVINYTVKALYKSKKTKILEFIQTEFLVDIFKQDFWKYKKSILKYQNIECIKFLETLSSKYEIDLGLLHSIPGKFTETKDPELNQIIKRYSKTFLTLEKIVIPQVTIKVDDELVDKVVKKAKKSPAVYKRITTILNKRKVKI